MTISLMPLPYAQDALEPHISSATLEVHHGAHHKAYVDKLNAAIEGTDEAGKPLEDIVKAASGGKFNNAAQVYNHGFYWHSLSPEKTEPSAALSAAIDEAFGSMDKLLEDLSNEAVNHFASGWAWLVSDGGKLKVISTHDAGTAITEGVNPLLTIDVWEHAYYVDQKNKRPAYVKAVAENLLNWKFASDNFDRGTAWVYPG
ncbi:MAG: superoxide dismutase [Novosphingobium sp.]|nr:superoxide dismutase [Novosphingobium sp.]